jgi:hypothetical protein
MDVVLGDLYLRKHIFSFLRKHPKVSCNICKMCCVWNKKVIIEYYIEKYSKKTICGLCFDMTIRFFNYNMFTPLKPTDTTKCIQIYTSSKIKNIHININI